MFAGDRFLASNLETIRIATTGLDTPIGNKELTTNYLVRALNTAAQLNPCQEDNYYLGNALLSWGGAEDEGLEVLKKAMECRYWDELPAFLYGFNNYFFYHDNKEAVRAINIAAERADDNKQSLKKLAIMITAGSFNELPMAIEYLKLQYKQASDSKLKSMLEKRIGRLTGLHQLRKAQKQFEQDMSHPLSDPNQLLEHRYLENFPSDPLGIGYEFRNGTFQLRMLQLDGVERPK